MTALATENQVGAKEGHKTKSPRLMAVATANMERHWRTRIKAVVDTDKDVLRGMVEYLQSQGRLDEDGEPMKAAAKRKVAPMSKKQKNWDGPSSPAPSPNGKTALDNNFTKVSNTPVTTLYRWLSIAEGSTFTEGNKASVIKRGDKEGSTERCCEILEHALGMDLGAPLFAAGREEGHCSV